jgi:hypothetical protein
MARKRKKGPYPGLPSSAFVYPKKRKYPINTKKRAKAALSYGARSDTFGNPGYIRGKVYKRYPSLRKGKKRR